MKMKNENDTPANHAQIAKWARQIWESEGRQPGRDLEYWLRAEKQVQSKGNSLTNAGVQRSNLGTAWSPGASKAISLPDAARIPTPANSLHERVHG